MYYNTFYVPPPRSDELYHHGVLGMKWGVRKYQNADGSLTSLGRSHYGYGDMSRVSTGKTKEALRLRANDIKGIATKTRKNIAGGYKQYTVNSMKTHGIKDAEYARMKAEQHRKTMKKVAIGAGIAVAAVGAYTAYKYHAVNYTDRVIKAGETIQTLSTDKNRLDNGKAIYTNFLSSDKKIYEGWFGRTGGLPKKALSATALSDVKIASPAAGKKTFNELMRNDSEFARGYNSLKRQLHLGGYKGGYDHFNAMILPRDEKRAGGEQAMELSRKFYDAMKAKGYGGVIDINDTKYSRLRGQAPTIMFDRSKFGETKVRQLTFADLVDGKAYADKVVPKITRSQNAARGDYLKFAANGSAIAAAYISTVSYTNAKRSYTTKSAAQRRKELGAYYEKNPNSAPVKYRQTRKNSQVVSAYRKEHPNSRLTYYEILRMQERI